MEKKALSVKNKTIRRVHDSAEILYLPLDIPSVPVVGYADAFFASNFYISSQLGRIALLKDKTDTAAIFYYEPWKCQRVTRPELGAEVHAFSLGLDFISQDLSTILQRKVSSAVFTD